MNEQELLQQDLKELLDESTNAIGQLYEQVGFKDISEEDRRIFAQTFMVQFGQTVAALVGEKLAEYFFDMKKDEEKTE